MPKWEDCMKIHEGCGGLVKWVEAVKTPGVGYYGKCTTCEAAQLMVEDIIPIEKAKVEAGVFLHNSEPEMFADLEWDDDATWDENQTKLKEEITDAL